MTSGKDDEFTDVKKVEFGGIVCRSDACLYEGDSDINRIHFLSLYGAPQQVRAIFTNLASGKSITTEGSSFMRIQRVPLRFRSMSIGYGKQCGVVYTENVGDSVITWTSESEKQNQLRLFLSRKKIPYEPVLLPAIEKLLIQNGYLDPLEGWGPINGYVAKAVNEDKICDLMITDIYGKRLKKQVKEIKKAA